MKYVHVQLPDRTKFENDCLKQQNEELRNTLSRIDLQAIGLEMGLKIGDNISGRILRFIKGLKAENRFLHGLNRNF